MSVDTTTQQPNVREWALRYATDFGFYPIAVPYLEKDPNRKAWQTERHTLDDIPQHFNGHRLNIGILLGAAQEGCDPPIDVDLDAREACRLAGDFLPHTGLIGGRKSKPRSHALYTCVDPPHTRQYKDPTDNTMLVELRGLSAEGTTGAQTIVYPSVRGKDAKKDPPDYAPERVVWDGYGQPSRVDAAEIVQCVGKVAAGALLVRHYPGVGGRHSLHLALAGGLLRAGWAREDVRHFARAIAVAAGDEECEDRLACVGTTADKLKSGQQVTGWPTLKDMLGEPVMRKLCEWLGVSRASDVGDASDATSQDSSKKAPSQATRLVELAESLELWRTPEGEAYATIPVGNHREHRPLRSKPARTWLARMYYEKTRVAIGAQALQDALAALEGRALFDGEEHPSYVRVARLGDRIYYDLANDLWQAVCITTTGWSVDDNPPIRFRRARGMLASPTPTRGGSPRMLWDILPIQDPVSRALLLAFLVGSLRPEGPYPVLGLVGEQGTGKSSVARGLKMLIDPSSSPLRSEPRNGHDLMIAATNSWLPVFDNLSYIHPWLSDAFCRLSTGGGLATRELYSDAEETIFDAQRPVILTSIEDVVTRGDLLDRSLIVQLQPMPAGAYRTEADLRPAFERVQPALLGVFLDAVSTAMRELPHTHLSRLPRMADLALWATAAEPALGLERGEFIRVYQGNRRDANSLALEADPVAGVLQSYMESQHGGIWSGAASALLDALTTFAGYGFGQYDKRPPRAWPKRGDKLSGILRRLAPNLRAAGVDITFERTGSRGRTIIIRTVTQSSVTGDTSGTAAHEAARGSDATGDASDARSAASDARSGTSDASDAIPPGYSNGEWGATDEDTDDFPF